MDPFLKGHGPIFKGSWRLQVDPCAPLISVSSCRDGVAIDAGAVQLQRFGGQLRLGEVQNREAPAAP